MPKHARGKLRAHAPQDTWVYIEMATATSSVGTRLCDVALPTQKAWLRRRATRTFSRHAVAKQAAVALMHDEATGFGMLRVYAKTKGSVTLCNPTHDDVRVPVLARDGDGACWRVHMARTCQGCT